MFCLKGASFGLWDRSSKRTLTLDVTSSATYFWGCYIYIFIGHYKSKQKYVEFYYNFWLIP